MDIESTAITFPEISTKKYLRFFYGVAVLFFCAAVLLTTTITYLNAPLQFNTPVTFTIEEGTGVRQVTSQMKELGLVRSETFLYLLLVTRFDPTSVKASTYVIETPLTSAQLARTLVEGDFANDLIRFTHIEGETAEKIAENAAEILPSFDTAVFLSKAIPLEGQLFPDTYFIPETYTADELVALLHNSFTEALLPLQETIANSDLSLEQILILASILEREANSPESMRLVSSVLQNRMKIGMPLQADASIEYILDKPLSELTPEDLEIDSPYNTYINPGLPPTPIGNPGIEAITATLEPTESSYFYYITADDGQFYFAETYDQHLTNIERYLR